VTIKNEFWKIGVDISDAEEEKIAEVIRQHLAAGLGDPLDAILSLCRPSSLDITDFKIRFDVQKVPD